MSRKRACELLGVARSSTYYEPEAPGAPDETDERRMAEIDRIHLESPAYGARKMAFELTEHCGLPTTRWVAARLMREMNIRSCSPQPSLSRPSKGSRRFPYLLRGKKVLFPNQVWSTDITYVQLGGRHMYLTAVIDWYSRYVVAWRLSDTMRAEEVVACAESAFEAHGTPSIMNSDQGSAFGSDKYVSLLEREHVAQSMDGRARWADNVLMERWFRTLKSEFLRLQEYDTPAQLERLISGYVSYYNDRRIHDSLGYDRPRDWYYSGIGKAA